MGVLLGVAGVDSEVQSSLEILDQRLKHLEQHLMKTEQFQVNVIFFYLSVSPPISTVWSQ